MCPTASKNKKQLTVRKFLKRKALAYGPNSKKKKTCDLALVQMIATDFQPYSIVDDAGFQHLVHTLDERYILPSRNHVKNVLLPSVCNQVEKSLAKILSEARYS